MKKLFLSAFLTIGLMGNAQTTIDLSGMTQNISLGSNCSNSQVQEEFITTGDCNLNGKTINLRNAKLTVIGNINGGGLIEGCGNSKVCRMGATQNNPVVTVEVVSCVVLGNEEFEFDKYGHKFEVYDIFGRLLLNGVTSESTYYDLPINQPIIMKVEGFEVKKIIKR